MKAVLDWFRERGALGAAVLLALGAVLVDSALWIISALLDLVFVGAMVWIVWAVSKHYRARLRESEEGRKLAVSHSVEAERQRNAALAKVGGLEHQLAVRQGGGGGR